MEDIMMNMNFNTNLEVKSDYQFKLQSKVENLADEFTVEFFIDELPGNRWQGIYKVMSKDCELAAASITSNIENLANELTEKIIMQIPNKYEFSLAQHLAYLNS